MSKTLVFVAFAANVSQSAGQGGAPQRALTLQGVTGDAKVKPAKAGPNDHLFDVPGAGRAQIALTGITEATIAGFKGGAQYRVEITELPETVAAQQGPAAVRPTPAPISS